MSHSISARLWLVAFALFGLAACGGGGGGGGSSAPANNPPNNPPPSTSQWDSLRWDNDNWA